MISGSYPVRPAIYPRVSLPSPFAELHPTVPDVRVIDTARRGGACGRSLPQAPRGLDRHIIFILIEKGPTYRKAVLAPLGAFRARSAPLSVLVHWYSLPLNSLIVAPVAFSFCWAYLHYYDTPLAHSWPLLTSPLSSPPFSLCKRPRCTAGMRRPGVVQPQRFLYVRAKGAKGLGGRSGDEQR